MTLDLDRRPATRRRAAPGARGHRRLRRTAGPRASSSARPGSIPASSSRRCSCRPGSGGREPIGSMPGVERVTPDEALGRPRGWRPWASAA